jgi:sugar/nucleoside kinase (ribokinase family)
MIAAPDRLVLVGSVIVDLLVRVPRLPDRGGDVVAGPPALQAGGGFNVLAAAARLGLPSALAGRVGTGPFGDTVRAALAAEGIAVLLAPDDGGDTGLCVGLVEPDAERTFITSPGVEAAMHAADLAGLALGGTDAVYVSGYDLAYPTSGPAITAWLRDAPPVLLVFDPGPLVAELPRASLASALDRCDVLTLNAREARLLTGAGDLASATSLLPARLRPHAAMVVRDGARGCTVVTGGAATRQPGHVVAAVDSTGAGDAHTGALLAGLHRGLDLVAAAGVANVAAALAVTRFGSATGPAQEELDAALRGGRASRGARPEPGSDV